MTDKVKLTTGLVTAMMLLGVSDAAIIEGLPGAKVTADSRDAKPPVIETQDKPDVGLPPGAVAKNNGPSVSRVLKKLSVEESTARGQGILSSVVPEEELKSSVLLQNGDRIGMVAWVESAQVKKHYLVLKEALHNAFTPDVTDLVDETQRREGRPTRNLLTFYDPGISSERIVFVRVRERLFEFHVSEGQSEVIFDIIEELTK